MNTSQTIDSLSIDNDANLDNMSTVTRMTLITLNSLLVALGLLGNSGVLFASLKYRAIDIDRISILLIENLAAADLLIVVLEFVPMLVTLIANGWVLGDIVCSVQSYGRYIPFVAEIILIMAMACYRVNVVLNPPLVPIRIVWFYVVVVLAWLITGFNWFLFLIHNPEPHFNPRQLGCTSSGMCQEITRIMLYIISKNFKTHICQPLDGAFF